MASTGEALVKGCLKYHKGFDTAETGMDVTFERDRKNTRGFGNHVMTVYINDNKLGHLDDHQARILATMEDEFPGLFTYRGNITKVGQSTVTLKIEFLNTFSVVDNELVVALQAFADIFHVRDMNVPCGSTCRCSWHRVARGGRYKPGNSSSIVARILA